MMQLLNKVLVFVGMSLGLVAQEAGFTQVYWASQPVPVQALQNMSEPQLSTTAKQLADAGFKIDVPIMVWQWQPYLVMMYREQQGLTWVPSANQEPLNLAGDALKYGFSGRTYNPKAPPEGSIRVSTNQQDYPPVTLPAPPVLQGVTGLPVGGPVGLGNRFYSTPAGNTIPAGQAVVQNGVTYKKFVISNVIGTTHFFEKQ